MTDTTLPVQHIDRSQPAQLASTLKKPHLEAEQMQSALQAQGRHANDVNVSLIRDSPNFIRGYMTKKRFIP